MPTDLGQSLATEKDCLAWLQGKLSVPQVIYYGNDTTTEYLLTSQIAGRMACDDYFSDRKADIVIALAHGLRLIHSLDIGDYPIKHDLDYVIKQAQIHVEAGLVDETDFDEARQGQSAVELLQELILQRLSVYEPVFTHGDYCLPNVLIDPETLQANGFVDWGRGGVSDKYQDLALAIRSIGDNFDDDNDWSELFFKTYGLSQIDQARIEFYQLLDEFF